LNTDSTSALLVQEYEVHFSVVPSPVDMDSNTRGRAVQLEFATTAYDREGHIVNGVRGEFRRAAPPDQDQCVLNNQYRVSQAVTLPTSTKFLRMAVLDKVSGRVGSLQVSIPVRSPQGKTSEIGN
jgi:hypothetical protein